MFEFFEHTADIGLRIRADSLEGLLADAAAGLFSLIVTNLDEVQSVYERSYQIPRDGNDFLLFDWLSELLFTFESEKLVLCRFELELQPDSLSATCRGELVDFERHHLDHEVKAITYHGLLVEQQAGKWTAEVIVDI